MAKKKNLLFIFADQWRREALGFMNSDPVLTPNMDAFAATGTYCTNAVCSHPLCSPSRASLLTGKYPLSHGVFTNCKIGLDVKLQEEEICIGNVLKNHGYRTGYIGKWHLDNPEQNFTQNPPSGARHWDAFTPPGPARHGFDFWYSYGACDEHLSPHYWMDTPDAIHVNEWSPIHETKIAIDFLKQPSKEPFALFLSYNPPHNPYEEVPEKYLEKYKNIDTPLRGNCETVDFMYETTRNYYPPKELADLNKQYYAAITGLDDMFGEIMKVLKEQGLAEDTYVVLSADHGDMMGSHGMLGKHVWYEESIGIPFVISGPDLPVGCCSTVMNSPDYMPTLLDLLGLPIPDSVEGESCTAELKGQKHTDRTAFISAYASSAANVQIHKDKHTSHLSYGWRCARNEHYAYVIDAGYLPGQKAVRYLYDLKNDPLEKNPVIFHSYPSEKEPGGSIAQELEQKLTVFLQQQKDNFMNTVNQTTDNACEKMKDC